MIVPQTLLIDEQGPAKHRFRLLELTLIVKERGQSSPLFRELSQSGQCNGNFWVVLSENFLPYRQRFAKRVFCLVFFALCIENSSQVMEHGRDHRVIIA